MQQYTYPQYRQYIPRPVITEDTIRRDTQKKLRKRCTAVGFYALTYTATMYVLSIGLLLLFQTLGISTDETLTQLQDIFISVGAAFIPGILFIAATGFKFREAFGKTTVGATTLIPLILMGMAVAMASNYAADIFETNLSIFGLQNTAGSVESSAMTPFEIILNIISVAIVPAFAEEFAYRGLVMGSLKKIRQSLRGCRFGNFVQRNALKHNSDRFHLARRSDFRIYRHHHRFNSAVYPASFHE